ncbi:MAG: hypothetical protein ACOZHQ_00335 [Thermodesulfobacteriota bacterium]
MSDQELTPELNKAAAVAEVFRAVEQVRADAHIKELEFNDKANERQLLQAREQRESNEKWFAKVNRRWWGVYSLSALVLIGLIAFSFYLIASPNPEQVANGWRILEVMGSAAAGFAAGWGMKAVKQG